MVVTTSTRGSVVRHFFATLVSRLVCAQSNRVQCTSIFQTPEMHHRWKLRVHADLTQTLVCKLPQTAQPCVDERPEMCSGAQPAFFIAKVLTKPYHTLLKLPAVCGPRCLYLRVMRLLQPKTATQPSCPWIRLLVRVGVVRRPTRSFACAAGRHTSARLQSAYRWCCVPLLSASHGVACWPFGTFVLCRQPVLQAAS